VLNILKLSLFVNTCYKSVTFYSSKLRKNIWNANRLFICSFRQRQKQDWSWKIEPVPNDRFILICNERYSVDQRLFTIQINCKQLR